MATIYEMTQQAAALYELLCSGEIDEQVFNDTLEAIEAEDKINSYCKIIRQLKADALTCKEEAARLTARQKTFESGAERAENILDSFMTATGKTKVKTDKFTVFYRETSSVNITDASKVPAEYLTPQEPKINKKSISEALKNGKSVAGAELQKNKSLNIR